MNVVESIPRYNYKDYSLWQGDWELIDGYPFAMSPSPITRHQILAKNFVYEIEHQFRTQKKNVCGCAVLYECDWIISDQDVVRPDVAIVCDNLDLNGFIRTPPVLIVEVFSASTRLKDRNIKFRLYAQCGVKYYVMADPDQKKMEVFELVDNAYKEMADNTSFQLTVTCSILLSQASLFADI